MEIMKRVANRHDLVCLLHEKPFASVNGSGKHNNWSLSTDLGENLLEPGDTPIENAQFLLFLLAVIKGVDEYQDLLRISVASAGNDHRLGADEAPPAIISVYLGDEFDAIIKAIEQGTTYNGVELGDLKIGVSSLPTIKKDSTDRNRTSPFAFTGNKFEFRMVGSSANIACPNFILNTIVAEELKKFADELSNKEDFNKALSELLQKTVKEHKRIIFSGNNYSSEWEEEASRRGLLNLKTTVMALPKYADKKNIDLFVSHKVLSESEVFSRMEILLENYVNVVMIEAFTAIDMASKEIAPAVMKYEQFVTKTYDKKKKIDEKISCKLEKRILTKLADLSEQFSDSLERLKEATENFDSEWDNLKKANYCESVLLPEMAKLRSFADAMELIIGKEYQPYPSYEDILYSVKY
jgi:glutamine synthetase